MDMDSLLSSLKSANEVRSLRVRFKKHYKKKAFKKTLIFGLEWHLLKGDGKDEIINACGESQGAFGSLIENDQEKILGVPAQSNNCKGTIPAAAIVASVYADAITVLHFEGDGYWLLATQNGVPVVHYDLVSDKEEIQDITKDLIDAYGDFTCLGDVEFWQSIGVKNALPQTFDEIFTEQRVTGTEPLKFYRGQATHILKTYGIAAALVLIAAVGWKPASIFVDGYLNRMESVNTQDKWIAQVDLQRNEIISQYNEIATNHPIDHWVLRLTNTINQLKLRASGWELASLECSAGLPHCLVTWRNQGVGTFRSIFSDVGHLGEISLKSAKSVEQVISIPGYQKAVFSSSEISNIVYGLPNEKNLKLDHASVMQQLSSINFVTGSMQHVNLREVGYPLSVPTDMMLNQKPIAPFKVGKWKLSGENISILIGSMQMLDPLVFFGKKLVIDFSHDGLDVTTKWEIEGEYTFKSKA